MNRFDRPALAFGLATVLIVADQLTKHWVRQNVPYLTSVAPIPALAEYFTFTHTINTGMAFGLFQDGNTVFTVIAIIVSAVIIGYNLLLGPGQLLVRVALGMQLGGAIGNLIDRVVAHPPVGVPGVTDFFHFRGFALGALMIPDAPIFNIADLAITSGVVVLILALIVESYEEQRRELAGVRAAEESDSIQGMGSDGGLKMTTRTNPVQVWQYASGRGPMQLLLRRGLQGMILGVLVGVVARRQPLGGLLGLLAGMIVGLLQLRPDARYKSEYDA